MFRWLLHPRYGVAHLAIALLVVMIGAVAGGLSATSSAVRQRDRRLAHLESAARPSPMPSVLVAPDSPECASHVYRQPYCFSEDWFTPHLPSWTRVLEPLQNKPGIRYLEVGVFEGRATMWMLENILTDPTARMVGIDIFEGEIRDRFFANLRLSGAQEKVTILNEYSQVALRTLPLESFDVIYIDGSHLKADALEDAVLCYRLLKVGGLLIFDDYPVHRPAWDYATKTYSATEVWYVQPALDAFYNCFAEKIEVLHRENQVIVRKTQ